MLSNEYGEDGGECVREEFVENVCKGYRSVVCDNFGVFIFMEDYDVAMIPFTK